MSSHHVIRDEQEPPVIILDDSFNLESLEQLLGWAPLVIIDASLLIWFQARKMKVDGLLISKSEPEEDYDPSIKHYFYEEGLLLQVIDSIVHEKNFTGVNIFCNEQMKSLILDKIKYEKIFDLPVSIFSDTSKTIISSHMELKKWYSSGRRIKYDKEIISVKPALQSENDMFVVKESNTYHFESSLKPLIITEY